MTEKLAISALQRAARAEGGFCNRGHPRSTPLAGRDSKQAPAATNWHSHVGAASGCVTAAAPRRGYYPRQSPLLQIFCIELNWLAGRKGSWYNQRMCERVDISVTLLQQTDYQTAREK